MKENITFYVDLGNGRMYCANQVQVHLFDFLTKLGLKTTPKTIMYMITTMNIPVGGFYTVSCNITLSNGTPQQVTSTVHLPHPPKPKLHVVPKPFLKPKNKGGFSRDQKREWKDKWKNHSRNTGRSFP